MTSVPFQEAPEDQLRERLHYVRAKLRLARLGAALAVLAVWVLSFSLFPGAVTSLQLFPTVPSAVISLAMIALHLVAERRVRAFEAAVSSHLGPSPEPGDPE